MADDGREGAAVVENPAKEPGSDQKQQRRGVLSRIWSGFFRGREDYEKRLQHLSKEEASVHARMKRRAAKWRKTARNIIVSSVILEVVAVAYAIMTTRSLDLNWQMRAVRVFPMFLLPGFSYAIYSALVSFTRMLDRKDQKTLERLRAERQAKINELKERTNYYTTQQLIQRYDPDPAAKAAAATVLASKLGADSGLKLYVGDETKPGSPKGKSNDVELVRSDGLRNRKPSLSRSLSVNTGRMHQVANETSCQSGLDNQGVPVQNQKVFEHHKSSGSNDGGWIARIAAMLVGEDPTQCFALICGNCRMHNGLARKEDFPHITYYCPHCHALNRSPQLEEHDAGSSTVSGTGSGKASALVLRDGSIDPSVSNAGSVSGGEVVNNQAAAVQGESVGGAASDEKEPDTQAAN